MFLSDFIANLHNVILKKIIKIEKRKNPHTLPLKFPCLISINTPSTSVLIVIITNIFSRNHISVLYQCSYETHTKNKLYSKNETKQKLWISLKNSEFVCNSQKKIECKKTIFVFYIGIVGKPE